MRWAARLLLALTLSTPACTRDEPSGSAENDPGKREALIAHIRSLAPWDESRGALVDHARFFDGNHDIGSIAWNRGGDRPGTYKVARTLDRLSKRPDVRGILVHIVYLMEENLDGWPTGGDVVLITTATPDEVRAWVQELKIVSASEGWPTNPPPPGTPTLAPGFRPVTIRWSPRPP